MRTEYIQTKVRPIKKVFIIESTDYESFAKIFIDIQGEIDIIQNLIFVNDQDLWSSANKEFVKRSDPDIILNLSTLDDEKLSKHFDIFTVKPDKERFKIGMFGSQLMYFSRSPSYFKSLAYIEEPFRAFSATKLENSAISLFACINYGLFSKEEKEYLELSIFKKMKIIYLKKLNDLVSNIFKQNEKFIYLTTQIGNFGSQGYGSSIYELNYDEDDFFKSDRRYLFVSEKNDFKTIAYFWNTRSYYSYDNLAWIPIEILPDISTMIDDDIIFVCHDRTIKEKVHECFENNEIIEPSRLYFKGRVERWKFFEHSQTINIEDNEIIIQHPTEKSFSDIGLSAAFVLEIRGLKEFYYPKRRGIGNLYFPKNYEFELFAERFQRIGELGLSKYILEINPNQAKDIADLFVLPTFYQVVEHLFNDEGFIIQKTPKTSIFEQTLNLLGGQSELSLLSDKNVFELLVSLTPKVRTEKVVKKIIEGIDKKITSDNILEIISEIRERGGVNFPSVTLTIDEILERTKLKGNSKFYLLPVLQKLYDQRVFLRGKYFECPSCHSKLWIQIDEINRVNYCIDCSNLIDLPVFTNNKQDSDNYRLNQLIVRAVDQGQLSTLLLVNLFVIQKYRAIDYLSNLEVIKDGVLITDIDLFIKIGKKIGVAECKSKDGFSTKQIDDLINIASILKCDFIAFSSLVESSSVEALELIEYLKKKDLKIPAFIFTGGVLFQPNSNMVEKYFERRRSMGFPVGPIVVS